MLGLSTRLADIGIADSRSHTWHRRTDVGILITILRSGVNVVAINFPASRPERREPAQSRGISFEYGDNRTK